MVYLVSSFLIPICLKAFFDQLGNLLVQVSRKYYNTEIRFRLVTVHWEPLKVAIKLKLKKYIFIWKEYMRSWTIDNIQFTLGRSISYFSCTERKRSLLIILGLISLFTVVAIFYRKSHNSNFHAHVFLHCDCAISA